jgi:hypothetical protein
MRLLRVLVAFSLLFAVNASAQTTTGSMSGTVVDSTGQVLPGATVTIVHERTGEQRVGTTSEVGLFSFAALMPGPYTVRVELSGFRQIEVKNNVVLANQRLAVEALKLEVGQISEVVSVSAVGEALKTTTTAHQAVLDLKQVSQLSIRGRDPISLLKILPGVQLQANDQETFGGSFATGVPAIQAGSSRGQTLYVDGVNGGDGGGSGGGGGNFSGATNLDAIAEVNVQMAAYTAEYGLKGGAQVNFITKHGGSEYHGTAYTYQRDKSFNSINFFNEHGVGGVPLATPVPKPEYRYSTFGGNLGGPVPKVPKVNPNGDKLFFFYSVDDTRLKNPQILRRFLMPTEAERRGDFSQTRVGGVPTGALIVVRDPLTGQPFPGNIVPANRLDPRGVAMMGLLPMPNTTGAGFNFIDQEASIPHPRRQHLLRVDYRPTSNDTLSVKGQTWFTKSVGINVAGASARWGLVRQRYDFTADQAKVDYTRILGANTVLEANWGVFDSHEDGPPENAQQLAKIQRSSYPALATMPQFAPANNPLNLIPKTTYGTIQSSGSTDWNPNIAYDNRWPITGHDYAIPMAVNVTHTRGAHTLKAGALREREMFQQARSGQFSGEFSFANDTNNPNNTGFAFSNMLLGQVTSYTESMGRVGDYRIQTTYAWFVQDQWKALSNLTVDLGLRMYKSRLPYHPSGEQSIFTFERFDPSWGGRPPVLYRPVTTAAGRRAVNPMTGEVLPSTFIGQMVPGTGYSCGPITPTTPCQINGVVPQENGNYVESGSGFVDEIPISWDPRVGAAWAVNDKTVVRVAGGSFHEGTGGFYTTGGPAYRFDRVIRFTDFNSYASGLGTTAPGNVVGVLREDKRPVTYRYTFGVQREIGWNTVLDLAFIGDKTHHLPVTRNMNHIPAGARFLPQNRDTTVAATAANPGAMPDVFLRPIVGFGDITITEPTGTSEYRSLQMQLTRRFTGGIELAGSYTWAKGYQNHFYNPANNSTVDVQGASVFQGNPIPAEKSRFRQNIQEHVIVTSYTIDLPNVGSRVGNNKASRGLLDNWSLSGISTFATGGVGSITFAPTDNFDFTGGGERCGNNNGSFPNITGDPRLSRGDRAVDRWFNTSAFSRPTGRGDIGNTCSNDHITLPGFHNHDLSIFKNFPLKGDHKLQFRWEIYNLFDQLSFNEVDLTAQFDAAGNQTDANFGKVTSARTERRMQFGLRYSF